MPKLAGYARNGRVVVFDTETTGCTTYDEICQIGAVEYVNGKLSRTFARYICPTCEMNPFAEMVHGLSLDFLHEHGLEPEEAMRQFFEFVFQEFPQKITCGVAPSQQRRNIHLDQIIRFGRVADTIGYTVRPEERLAEFFQQIKFHTHNKSQSSIVYYNSGLKTMQVFLQEKTVLICL